VGKGGQCVGLTTLPPGKSGSLTLLEPSGHVKACNGIALLLPYFIFRFHLKFLNRPSCLRSHVQSVGMLFIKAANLDKIQLNN
jgi:hypothetical protein